MANVKGYRIYRDGAQIADIPETGLSSYDYADSSISDCTDYSYTIVSYNSSGTESENCASASVHVPDLTPPSVPVTTASANGGHEIQLSWGESADRCEGKAAGYNIYNSSGAKIGTTTETSFSVTGLSDCTEYCFTVSAYDSAGNESLTGAPACARTLDVTPPAVPVVTATAISGSEISLTWPESADKCEGKAAGYRIYNSSGALIGTTAGTSFNVAGLSECTDYCFSVVAYDGSGNVSAPGSTCAKTPTVAAVTAPLEGKCGGSFNINSAIVIQFQITQNGVPLGPVQIGMPVARLYRVSGGALVPVPGSIRLIGNNAGNWQVSLKPSDYGLTPGDYVIMIEPSPTGGTLCSNIIFNPAPTCGFTLEQNGNGKMK